MPRERFRMHPRKYSRERTHAALRWCAHASETQCGAFSKFAAGSMATGWWQTTDASFFSEFLHESHGRVCWYAWRQCKRGNFGVNKRHRVQKQLEYIWTAELVRSLWQYRVTQAVSIYYSKSIINFGIKFAYLLWTLLWNYTIIKDYYKGIVKIK